MDEESLEEIEMSNTVATRFHKPLPGGGRDVNGNPVQGKVEVRGVITVTSFTAGESLTPADLGLTTIDYIDLRVDEPVGGASGGEVRTAHYSYAQQEFYVVQDNDSTTPVGNSFGVRFNAFGDTVRDNELL